MGKKLLVSLAMEGKLQAEGLQAMDEDDDLLTAMARELVTRQGVGEAAAEVWRSLQMQRDEPAPAIPELPPASDEVVQVADVEDLTPWTPSAAKAVQLSLF